MDHGDGRELGGERAVALLVVGEALGGVRRWHLVSSFSAGQYPPSYQTVRLLPGRIWHRSGDYEENTDEQGPPHPNRPTARRAGRDRAASGARCAPEPGRAGAWAGEHRLRVLGARESNGARRYRRDREA